MGLAQRHLSGGNEKGEALPLHLPYPDLSCQSRGWTASLTFRLPLSMSFSCLCRNYILYWSSLVATECCKWHQKNTAKVTSTCHYLLSWRPITPVLSCSHIRIHFFMSLLFKNRHWSSRAFQALLKMPYLEKKITYYWCKCIQAVRGHFHCIWRKKSLLLEM